MSSHNRSSHPIASDKRSRSVVVTAHCFLNQNAKLEGLAQFPGMIHEVVTIIQQSGSGILQLPCPEMLYEGMGRFDKSIEQYRCAAFVRICTDIARDAVDQVQNYLQWDYSVPAFLTADGSPSCGLTKSQSAPEWRGSVTNKPWSPARYLNEPGILTSLLQEELRVRGITIPFIAFPETPELGDFQTSLGKLKSLLIVK